MCPEDCTAEHEKLEKTFVILSAAKNDKVGLL